MNSITELMRTAYFGSSRHQKTFPSHIFTPSFIAGMRHLNGLKISYTIEDPGGFLTSRNRKTDSVNGCGKTRRQQNSFFWLSNVRKHDLG